MPRSRANRVSLARLGRIAVEPADEQRPVGFEEIALGVDVDEDERAFEHGWGPGS